MVGQTERRACIPCQTLQTGVETCWCCGGPTVPAHLTTSGTSPYLILRATEETPCP